MTVAQKLLTDRVSTNGKSTPSAPSEKVTIAPLKQAVITIPIIGTTPLKVLRFSQKKQDEIRTKHQTGEQPGSRRKRPPKNFEQDFEDAKYRCTTKEKGKKVTWLGINATGIRNGCIETCRVAGFVMTRAKFAIFCEADGMDDIDATPLVRVFGKPEMCVDSVRNESGVVDLRSRVMFREWKMVVRIRFDEGQFSASDIINLMIRVGQQNGLCEGRPNSKNGNGTGNGLFVVDVDKCALSRSSTPPVFHAL